jgi:IS4 transposase
MAFAQVTGRESLRDIEVCLRSLGPRLYHLGFRGRVSKSTLADANEAHDWRIWADLAQALIAIARPLYAHETLDAELEATVYALDSSTIDLCLSLFPWAHFQRTKSAVKLHTLLDLRYSRPAALDQGVLSDHTAILHTPALARAYPDALRRVRFHDAASDQRLVLLTNNFELEALTIPRPYKARWRIELFFKWIKQHLRVKAFYGLSENAVKTQIWIAMATYLLVAILKNRLGLDASLYKFLHVLSITILEKTLRPAGLPAHHLQCRNICTF